jgi:hypothetical protein
MGGRFLDAPHENLSLPKGGSLVLQRTKIGQALVGAAFLMTAACHGGSNALPAMPVTSEAIPAPALDPDKKPKPPKLLLSPKAIAFTAVGSASAKKLVASEKNYKGKFKVTSTCGSAVTISPKSAKGPKATLTLTPVAAVSSCTVTVSDTKKQKATAKISVVLPAPPALNVNPSSLSFDATGSTYASTFAITQTGTGAFKETDTCSGIATVAAPSLKAPSSTVTVTPSAAGTCTITITDAYAQIKTVAVSVTTSGIIIQ